MLNSVRVEFNEKIYLMVGKYFISQYGYCFERSVGLLVRVLTAEAELMISISTQDKIH